MLTDALAKFGYIPFVLFLVGVLLLTLKGSWKSYGLVFSAVIVVALPTLYSHFRFGDQVLADRSWLLLMTMMALIGGYGIAGLRALVGQIPGRSLQWVAPVGYAGVVALVVGALAVAVRHHQNEFYYHLVDDLRYSDFAWIRAYVGDTHPKAIVHPATGLAFAPITGKYVYTNASAPLRDHPGNISDAFRILNGGVANTDDLYNRLIQIVYEPRGVENPDLIKARHGVYLYEDSRFR